MTGDRATRIDELLVRAAREHAAEQDELAQLVLDRVRETVPEFFADDDVAFDMRAAVEANVERFRELLLHLPAPADRAAPPHQAGDLLQSTIQHAIPLMSLLEAYRSAQGVSGPWWQDRLERLAPPGLLGPAVRRLHEVLGAYIDAAALEIRASYELERRALETSIDGRRAHVVRKLLAGELDDLDAASRTLNHPLDANHVALVVWRADGEVDEAALRDAITRAGETLGEVRTLTTAARHRIYAWFSTRRPLDVAPLRECRLPPGVRAAMSGTHRGARGFAEAHRDATRVASSVRDGDGDAGEAIAAFEDHELVALLTHDDEASGRFVARVLGPLCEDTSAAASARRTLEVFLACGLSPTRAASHLGVHRNTVTYRIKGLGELGEELMRMDREWTTLAARRLEIELALRIVRQRGPVTAWAPPGGG